jgi:ABC-type branched-subunit amino acid transport system substrate-binding protein
MRTATATIGRSPDRSTRRRLTIGVLVTLAVSSGFVAVPTAAIAAGRAATASTCPDPSGTVKVGVSFLGSTAASVAQKTGTELEQSPGDQAAAQAIKDGAAALNAAGGIAGCDVEPVIFNFSVLSSDYNGLSQQECAAFTQDNHVIAVYAAGYETKLAADCFAKAKIPSFWIQGLSLYQPSCEASKTSDEYIVAGVLTCRAGSFIKMWDDAGLFPNDAKVGVLEFDSVDGKAQNKALVDDLWAPQLKKLGISLQTFTVTRSLSSSGYADVSTQISQAVLQFKAAGVNVVLFTPPGATMVTTFVPAALAQAYFPNYGLTTTDGPRGVGLAPDGVKKAVAISWQIVDLALDAQLKLPTNPAIEGCAQWSLATSDSPTGPLTGASNVCDFYNILAAGFDGAKKLDAPTLRKGIAGLGTTFDSAMTYDGATKFSGTRLDGASMANILVWDPNTMSFVPKSKKLVPIP